MWTLIDRDTDTRATEIPGLGCIVGCSLGLVFVPGARLLMHKEPIDGITHTITRDQRTNPPLVNGPKAADIAKRALPDPGATQFFTVDDPEY